MLHIIAKCALYVLVSCSLFDHYYATGNSLPQFMQGRYVCRYGEEIFTVTDPDSRYDILSTGNHKLFPVHPTKSLINC